MNIYPSKWIISFMSLFTLTATSPTVIVKIPKKNYHYISASLLSTSESSSRKKKLPKDSVTSTSFFHSDSGKFFCLLCRLIFTKKNFKANLKNLALLIVKGVSFWLSKECLMITKTSSTTTKNPTPTDSVWRKKIPKKNKTKHVDPQQNYFVYLPSHLSRVSQIRL